MKYSLIAAAIVGAVSAVVLPRNQPCAPLRDSSNVLVPNPVNSPEAFASFSWYGTTATFASKPSGFETIFTNYTAAVLSYKYQHFVDLDAYNPDACAATCNVTPGCDAFNIYFMRHPSVEPAVACPNPKANTVVRCGLYSQPVLASEAQIVNQTRGPADASGKAFQIVIAGSNAYNRAFRAAVSDVVADVPKVTVAETIKVTETVKIVVTESVAVPTVMMPAVTVQAPTVTPPAVIVPAETVTLPAVTVPAETVPADTIVISPGAVPTSASIAWPQLSSVLNISILTTSLAVPSTSVTVL
ncbi:hypothetical protein EK21DRAFT_111184 [Setomelanomma holmii]|uniref:Apple domain-containing protein n=1 Tax=Setomelanomma holmii TaxID=210430 RepID=A0A9P4HBE9_9PLEO|nr:hypothetical protein EK21DRAFT_111184 [Setomelanomma holmii]